VSALAPGSGVPGVVPIGLDPGGAARGTVPAPTPVPAVWRVLRRVGGAVGGTIVSAAIVLGVWQLLIEIFQLDSFIARGPLDVWRHLTDPLNVEERALLVDASWTTLRDALLGLSGGTVAAVIVAIVFTLRRSVEQVLLPLAMVLRTVPLVAMTPLIALVFGRGVLAVTIIAGIVTFFPTLVNVSLALRSVPGEAVDVLRAYGATPFTTLRKVQLPASLPALFASLRIAAPLALIGALLAEWLATGQGLGYLMLQAVSMFQNDRLWAAVAIVTLASVLAYNLIATVERIVLARYAPGTGQSIS
jgi:ABC-type nitrate/sulfonate/bicarbonate transport system permease component